MISPIQLTPNMDAGTLTSAINQNFQQIEAENRTKIIKDQSGTNRILLGLAPDGTYILGITVEGKDILDEYAGTS